MKETILLAGLRSLSLQIQIDEEYLLSPSIDSEFIQQSCVGEYEAWRTIHNIYIMENL